MNFNSNKTFDDIFSLIYKKLNHPYFLLQYMPNINVYALHIYDSNGTLVKTITGATILTLVSNL